VYITKTTVMRVLGFDKMATLSKSRLVERTGTMKRMHTNKRFSQIFKGKMLLYLAYQSIGGTFEYTLISPSSSALKFSKAFRLSTRSFYLFLLSQFRRATVGTLTDLASDIW
jgi:hypothetical protein